LKRYIVYLKKVLTHKWFVFLACLNLGVPFYLAVLHDISKFSSVEFVPYAKYFYNKKGESNQIRNAHGSYDPAKQADSFRYAWLHHQNHNKHHFGYWCIIGNDSVISPMQIPDIYVREMIADWIGAGKAYSSKSTPQEWYDKEKGNLILHEKTRIRIEELLGELDGTTTRIL